MVIPGFPFLELGNYGWGRGAWPTHPLSPIPIYIAVVCIMHPA